MSEVRQKATFKLPSNKSLLVLGKLLCFKLNPVFVPIKFHIDCFIVGDIGCGKTTVIAKLQGVEDPKKGAGLEYAYIDVRDEYRDGWFSVTCLMILIDIAMRILTFDGILDHTRLGAWILDGDPSLSFLLKYALNEETYSDVTIMFVVSMTTPWNILDQLQSWAAILQDHIDKLKISSHDLEEYRNKCKSFCEILRRNLM